jgi:hypothetical protein
MTCALSLRRWTDRIICACILAVGVFATHQAHAAPPPATSAAAADGSPLPPPESTYLRECGDCHLAYPVRLLPATTWRALMSGLDRHFGVDASLDPATAAAISAWLARSAAAVRPSSRAARVPERPIDASLRISTTPWFVREHREVPATTWSRTTIGSASNCAACHADARQGRFSERALRIPR